MFAYLDFFVLNTWMWSKWGLNTKQVMFETALFVCAVSTHHLHHLVDCTLHLEFIYLQIWSHYTFMCRFYSFIAALIASSMMFCSQFCWFEREMEKEFKTLKQLLMTCWFLWAMSLSSPIEFSPLTQQWRVVLKTFSITSSLIVRINGRKSTWKLFTSVHIL